MAALYRFGERARVIILLLAVIVEHLHRIMQYAVRVVDDSELTFDEVLGFAQQEGPIWVGKWKERTRKLEEEE